MKSALEQYTRQTLCDTHPDLLSSEPKSAPIINWSFGFSGVGLSIRDQSKECLNKFQVDNYGMNVNSFGSREEVIAVDCQESG